MKRVTKRLTCPICGKPDWCLVGKSVVVCMRTLSPRSKTFSDGSVGYIHQVQETAPEYQYVKPDKPKPVIDMTSLAVRYWAGTSSQMLADYANTLGVSKDSVTNLRAAYYGKQTWAFPMYAPDMTVVGIRLRANNGIKWAVPGSHQGLFIPKINPKDYSTVFLPEGPTNTAALLTLGVFAIGRPSCNGGIYQTVDAVARLGFKRAVVMSDTDTDIKRDDGSVFNPGMEGAMLLSNHLKIPSCTLMLPTKDARDFVRNGGDRQTLDCLVNQCQWRKPT